MSITVIKPGLQTTLQDLGRQGHQHLGVPVSGAMDTRAHRLANLLVGNSEDQATLEVILSGPTLQFNTAACIAICGAPLSPTLNGQSIPNNRPLIVMPGDTLAFGTRTIGLRTYVAIHGGFDVAPVMGSRSTFLRGNFGGFEGRALKKGDILNLHTPLHSDDLDALSQEVWKITVYLPAILGLTPRSDIRVVAGHHADLFTQESLSRFYETEYRVSPESERMGYRLTGAKLVLQETTQIVTEVTSFGTIQVPPDGNPIILMADRQTTGGYVKIAHVITVDLPLVAQTMPGETLRFQEITLGEAQQLDNQREEAFGRLFQGLAPLRELLTVDTNDITA